MEFDHIPYYGGPIDCRIRPAESTDFREACRKYREVDLLHAQERPDRFRYADRPARSRQLFEGHLSDADQALFVADVDGIVVGLVQVRAHERLKVPDVPAVKPRHYAIVQELIVAQAHQRRGIGVRLMIEAHRLARNRGLT